MNKTRGIIYVATGKKHCDEAVISARQVKKIMPDMSVTIFTDQEVPEGLFDHVKPAEPGERGRKAKIRGMASSPYEQTLFLDSDTYMCQSCEDVFWPLERYDLAVVHEVYRNEYAFEHFPTSFPSLNTGVVALNNTPEVREFLQQWEDSYINHFSKLYPADQPAFRHCLFHSSLKFYILPPEYNFRTNYPVVLGGFSSVKILHDRNPHVKDLAALLGHDNGQPPVYFGPLRLRYFTAWCRIRFKTILFRLRAMGWRGVVKRLSKR
jgi:alpha-N-acetylglucosamine transferase